MFAFGIQYQTFITKEYNRVTVSQTKAEYIEVKHMFPDCTVIVQSVRGEHQAVVAPPTAKNSTTYCTVIAEYIESLGYVTTLDSDTADEPYVRAKPLPKEEREPLVA